MGELPRTFLEALVERVRKRGDDFNPAEYSRPVAILWPDAGKEWEPLLPLLRDRLPVLTLGPYDPATRTGPSYWVRCMLARVLEDRLPDDEIPVVYLPGFSKQDLRGIEECSDALKPIASMQYEGALFTQLNGKDWTIRAFIESQDGGLGIAIGGDNETKKAALRAVVKLADVTLEEMHKEAPLRAAFFDLKFNPDQALALLRWLNDADGVHKEQDDAMWGAFASLCRSRYGFDPDKDGVLKPAQKLGERLGQEWELVWSRFTEAPGNYLQLPDLLRRARPKKDAGMFARQDSWPQDNDAAEAVLRGRLVDVGTKMPAEARADLLELEAAHARRREWVWATLGQAQLAEALEHLARLATLTGNPLGGASVIEIANAYADWGWQADAATIRALASVDRPEDLSAVSAAIRSVYRPWLEEAAKQFQLRAGDGMIPIYPFQPLPVQPAGTCLMFVDGLRFDVAHMLSERLQGGGLDTEVGWRLTALPTVTATAKPAASPVGPSLRGGTELSPATISGSKVEIGVLRKLLAEADFQVLLPNDPLGGPSGLAWSEDGNVDETGHTEGIGLARHLDGIVQDIAHRIRALLAEGWKQVVVVTDHGFLLMPGGLPKVQIPEHLTEIRKGRCARLKPSSTTEHQTIAWHWDQDVRFAIAPGISCFEAGKEYEHGGLSPQECVTPLVTVRSPGSSGPAVSIESTSWSGMRCRVALTGAPAGTRADIRDQPANAESSITGGGKAVDDEGRCSLLVPDDDRLGTPAYLVVLAEGGSLLLQAELTVGGSN